MAASEAHETTAGGPAAGPSSNEDLSLVDAVERVTQAGVAILENRAELIQLEIRAAGARLMTGALRVLGATVFFVVAWVALVGAGFFAMRDSLGEVASLGVIVVVNAVLGFVVVAAGRTSNNARVRSGEPAMDAHKD